MRLTSGQKKAAAVAALLFLLQGAYFVFVTFHKNEPLTVGFFVEKNYRIYEIVDRVAADCRIEIGYTSGIMRDDYGEWLAAAFIAGKEPDVFLLPAEDYSLYVKTGALAELPDDFATVRSGGENAAPEAVYAVPLGADFVAVSARSKQKELAFKFLRGFVMEKANNK